ncbi:DNA-methyltransferase [Neisseria musculi]|uniref:DNA-methyltransferase n=1 Tax=Neisseria musculi TaxID=1815583 RepID=UPI00164B7375|nr:site-specific DNA-methyltransferase [Neisseria musculi]QNT59549.1 DNA methylase family protein [Neisseria musculi]
MRRHDRQSALYTGDCRQILPALAAQGIKVQTCITSPPYYGLRDYGCAGQIGLEPTVAEYIDNLVQVFRLVRDVPADDGTLWLNLGDSYAGSGKSSNTGGSPFSGYQDSFQTSTQLTGRLKAHGFNEVKTAPLSDGLKVKDLIGIPWRVALALQADGWYLRQDIIWHKTNPMPESVTDRCARAHEYLFLLSKNSRYCFDHEAIREPSDSYERPGADRQHDFCRAKGKYTATPNPGQRATQHRSNREHTPARPLRNKRSVWPVATVAARHDHLAAFPPKLVEPCILAGSRPGDVVLDPFSGSGTVAETANRLGRRWIGIELNPAFADLHGQRTAQQAIGF